MAKFLNCLGAVLFLFLVGNAVLVVGMLLLFYGFGVDYWTAFRSWWANGYALYLVGSGCVAVALAIYDGNFAQGYVEDSHWTNKRND